MENNVAFSKYKLLAIDIYEWCKKHGLWGDNIIYFDGKAWSSSETWGRVKGKKIAEDLYEYAKDPDGINNSHKILSLLELMSIVIAKYSESAMSNITK